MDQIVYSSAARRPFSEAQLTDLLARARKNNERLAVTGMLLYHEASFLQVLEGAPTVLRSLYEVISQDQRHHRIVPLLQRTIAAPHFGQWRMGFASLHQMPRAMPGFSDYLRLREHPTEAASAAERLLAAFRDGRFHSYVSA